MFGTIAVKPDTLTNTLRGTGPDPNYSSIIIL